MLAKAPINSEVKLKYQQVKLAWQLYKKTPEELDAETFAKLEKQAMLAQQITEMVIATPEAANEQVKELEIQERYDEIVGHFDNVESFLVTLKGQGLTEESLRVELYHMLLCEQTLATQSQDYPKVTEQEALSYYENNLDRFLQPERRKASHILVTINDEYEENERPKAQAKIEKLASRLKDHINDFANLALQHSECPTSLNNGLIGDVSRGQLYPELDLVLFNMQVNEISSVIETELGFHLIVCHEILPAGEIEKQDALQQITTQLNEHRQKKLEKKWISNLFAKEQA